MQCRHHSTKPSRTQHLLPFSRQIHNKDDFVIESFKKAFIKIDTLMTLYNHEWLIFFLVFNLSTGKM